MDYILELEAERDQALARAAAAAMEMRERAVSVTVDLGPRYDGRPVHYHIPENVKSAIRTLPIDPDAQKALDQMLAKAREDAIREAAGAMKPMLRSMLSRGQAAQTILALLNEGEQNE